MFTTENGGRDAHGEAAHGKAPLEIPDNQLSTEKVLNGVTYFTNRLHIGSVGKHLVLMSISLIIT